MRTRYAWLVSVALVLPATACTGDGPGERTPSGAPPAGVLTEGAADTSRGLPRPAGRGSIAGTAPAGARPTRSPAQSGGDLAGRVLPTNQWWTSALTGPYTQPMWAHPLAVRGTAAGVQVSAAPPAASANAVVTPFLPAITAGGAVKAVRVVGYGAFHVVLRADLARGGAVEVTLVQGSPLLYLRYIGTTPSLTAVGSPSVVGADGTVIRLDVGGQRWDLLSEDGTRWTRDGGAFRVDGARDGRVVVARVPDGVTADAWNSALAASAADPVVKTTALMSYDNSAGTVTQTLRAERASGRPGVWALLPHQRAGLVPEGTQPMTGTYAEALGPLTVVRAVEVRVRVPMPGLLTAAPTVPLPASGRTAVVADLDADLAQPARGGGSYFGLKELGRLATVAEVAGAVGATAQRDAALEKLRPRLVDWLTYGGPRDGRYFAYDKAWGGLTAVPPEFGSSDYNDHHFQYAYLVRAAAVMADADPAFLADYGPVVDLVVRDFAGALALGDGPGLPAFRSFNAYLGHSAASGFAPFADGNNQESSSEAVAAWEAATRWGLVRDDPRLTEYGLTHHAVEAATARAYWLGEGISRPPGYAHTVAGIVWDAKLDYATFFDPRPESVQGIQLLPLTFGSLYRADPKAAATRGTELEKAVGGQPRIWGDLFAADLALTDPAAARQRLGPDLPREESTSRALVRYWVEMLAGFGPPQPAVVADAPYGLAFGRPDDPTLVAVNPTASRRTVTFRSNGKVVGTVVVEPGRAVSRTR